MKFSLLIVTFNRKKSLLECLRSIQTQSVNFLYEVIIVLNGDISYLEKYKSTFPQYKFIHIPQTTKADARNFAIREGRKWAKWIFPFDSNIFVTDAGWKNIAFYLDNLNNKVYKVSMYRVRETNDEVWDFAPENYDRQESQVVVRHDNFDVFDESIAYANGNKEEFLLRFPKSPYLEYVIRLNDQTHGYLNEQRNELRMRSIPIFVSLVDKQVMTLTATDNHQ